MICPDFFGCSGKLSFSETQKLSFGAIGHASGGDFSSVAPLGPLATSIDRIHRCAPNWDGFARIALNHAFGDVICAGAKPVQAMLSFEFGPDTAEAEYADCSKAFARELAARGVALGKCHSGKTDGITAVTVATLAANPTRLTSQLESGSIYLSRPVGALKLHYLAQLQDASDKGDFQRLLENPVECKFQTSPWALMTDVSGHGLLGAVVQVAHEHNLDIEMVMSADHAISPEVLSREVECLHNPIESYGFSIVDVHPLAALLVTLRETAGPFLGFFEHRSMDTESTVPGLFIGKYHLGDKKVSISWSA
jgi:hydrogenase maturation factor